MMIAVLLVTASLINSLRVAVESQPLFVMVWKVYVPGAEYDWPFQVYGSSLVQMETFVVLVTWQHELISRISVAMESQPVLVVVLKVYVPALL